MICRGIRVARRSPSSAEGGRSTGVIAGRCVRRKPIGRSIPFAIFVPGLVLGAALTFFGFNPPAAAEGHAQAERPEARDGWKRFERRERWHELQREGSEAGERWRQASPEERHRMRGRMKRLRRQLPDFSRIELRLLLRKLRDLPEAEEAALRERILGLESLEPEKRHELLARLRSMIEADADEIDRLERNRRRWDGMSESQREDFRKQMRRFREMPDEDRRQLLDQWSDPTRNDESRKRRDPKSSKP